MVTSRPVATVHLSDYLHDDETTKHVEIVGFNKTQIADFARKAFRNETKLMLKNFTDYYTHNPYIEAMMYVPLNAAIISYVFKTRVKDQRPPPHSLTGLYGNLVCTLIQRQRLKLRHFKDPIPESCRLMTTQDINKLPPKVKRAFKNLMYCAYNGTLHQRYIFSGVKNDLGLMNKVPSIYDSPAEAKYSYNFFHTTLQEYLAAMYVAQNSVLMEKVQDREVVVMFVFGIFSQMKSTVDRFALSNVFNHQTCQLRHLYEYPNFIHVNPHLKLQLNKDSCGYPFDFYIAGHLIANFNVTVCCTYFYDHEYESVEKFVDGLKSKPRQGTIHVGKGSIEVLSIIYDCDWSYYSFSFSNAVLNLFKSNHYSKQTLRLGFKTDLLCPLRITSKKERISFECGGFTRNTTDAAAFYHAQFKNLKVFIDLGRVLTGNGPESKSFLSAAKREMLHLEGEIDILHVKTLPFCSFKALPFVSNLLFNIFKDLKSLSINTLILENTDFRDLPSDVLYTIAENHKIVKRLLLYNSQPEDFEIFTKTILENNHDLVRLEVKGGGALETIFKILQSQSSNVIHLGIPLMNNSNFTNLLLTKTFSSLKIWWDFMSGEHAYSSLSYKFFNIINSKTFFVNHLHIILASKHMDDKAIQAVTYMIRNYTGKSICTIHIPNDFPINHMTALIKATTMTSTTYSISIAVEASLYSQLPYTSYLRYTKLSNMFLDTSCDYYSDQDNSYLRIPCKFGSQFSLGLK